MEKDTTVIGRPKDRKLLDNAAEEAAAEFEKEAGFKVKIEVNEELGDKSCVSSSLDDGTVFSDCDERLLDVRAVFPARDD